MPSLASIRMYTDKHAHKYTQIPAVGQRTHLYPWGVRMHFESCWHGFSSGAQKSSFSSHSSPVDTSTHTRYPNMSKCVCVGVCLCFPSSHSKKSSISFGKDACKHTESQKNFITLENVHLQSLLTWNILQPWICTFVRDMKKAQEIWKSRKG